jgi:cold shock CspA family protein
MSAMDGTMLWFNDRKGFGLISTDDEERLLVARSGFRPGEAPEGRCAGRRVVFDVSAEGEDRQAVNVSFCPEAGARRARRRHGSRTH